MALMLPAKGSLLHGQVLDFLLLQKQSLRQGQDVEKTPACAEAVTYHIADPLGPMALRVLLPRQRIARMNSVEGPRRNAPSTTQHHGVVSSTRSHPVSKTRWARADLV
jgi:hypothetical protein